MTRSLLLCILTASLTLACAACEKSSEFDASASAKAPTTSVKTPEAPAAAPGAQVTPSTGQMPAGHPPVGATVQRAAPLAGAPAGASGPLTWPTPEGWQVSKPKSQMRLAEFIVPSATGGEPGEMSIFMFNGQGPDKVGPNIDRWVGQFTKADGSPIDNAVRKSLTVNGVKVHTVDLSGTYGGGMGGGGKREDFRVLGAIAEYPGGLYFFKLIGPAQTLKANEAKFNEFVQGLKKKG